MLLLLGGVVAVIVGVNVFFLPDFERQSVFQPEKEILPIPLDYSVVNHHSWFIPHPTSDKVVLFCHGNASNISEFGPLYQLIQELGLNILAVEYPGYGKSEEEPTEEGLYQSAGWGYNYLTETLGFKPENITVIGYSLGGAVASKLATQKPVGRLILMSSIASVAETVHDVYPMMGYLMWNRLKFDTALNVKKISCPVMILHSRDDLTINVSQGEKIFKNAHEPKQFLTSKSIGHGEPDQLFKEHLTEIRIFIEGHNSQAQSYTEK